MTTDTADLQLTITELKAENERLRNQLAESRAKRIEYMKLITELFPADLPSEDEMREQMKNLVSADEMLKVLSDNRERRAANGS